MPGPDLRFLLLSDATGSTLAATVKAALGQFPDESPTISLHPFLRDAKDIAKIPDAEFARASAVIYTLVSPDLRDAVLKRAFTHKVPVLSLLDPFIDLIATLTDRRPLAVPGGQYRVDDTYMAQIAAMDFAISNDDGVGLDRLLEADVILTGVSRTSKTPTCIYLGYQGIRAANVPIISNCKQYPDLEEALAAGIPGVALTASATRLSQVRKTRLRALGSPEDAAYTDVADIEEELVHARLYFERLNIPVIDVTRRSIEETAAAVLHHAQRGEAGA